MLRLIPAPLHRFALRIAYRLRQRTRRATGKTRDGVSIIGRDIEGQILLIRHSYGPDEWFFPGGGIDSGETPEAAAHRELMEETACEMTNVALVGTIQEELAGAPHCAHVFEGVIDDMPVPDGREVVVARFFPTHSLPEPLSARTRARLDMWHRKTG